MHPSWILPVDTRMHLRSVYSNAIHTEREGAPKEKNNQ